MAKPKRNISRAPEHFTPPPFTCPAISVIIPLYNAEKYIAECLESILAQTFKNFEVIVVDDCSTDSSCAIVESYIPKFGERLMLERLEKNSGGGGYVPRNKGLLLSRGEYIFFADADDFVTETALEELYTAAKNFDADVVYTGAHYSLNEKGEVYLIRDPEALELIQKGLEDKPTLTLDDADKNVRQLLVLGRFHMPWAKFVQRNFLLRNEISFPKIISGGDFIWTIQVLYFAKKFLRIPNAIYFYRQNVPESVTQKRTVPEQQIIRSVSAFVSGVEYLHELKNKVHVLKDEQYYYAAVNPFFINVVNRTFEERMKLTPRVIYEILQREFADDSNAFAMAFLFSVVDAQQKNLIGAQQHIARLEAELKRLKS